ncbi:hypothetical protein EYY99_05235 [Hafnia alvei]|nr:hypothetical protein EYY99_05235 [Hafnia alvei]
MDDEKASSQQGRLKETRNKKQETRNKKQETRNEQRSREIRKGKAWLSVQRMLKRSGKTCSVRVADDRTNAGDTSFDIDTV